YNGIAQLKLAVKVMEQRPLGQPRNLDDIVQTPRLETVPVKLVECAPKDPIPCHIGWMGCFHSNRIIPTSWYDVNRPGNFSLRIGGFADNSPLAVGIGESLEIR